MKKKIFIVLMIFLCLSAFGQTSQKSRKRYALVIGNQNYKVFPLSTNIEDANMIADSLSEKEFDVTLKKDLSYEEMDYAVTEFINKVNADPEGVVLFYYSGHAFADNDENYLLPIDNDIFHTAEGAKKYGFNIESDVAGRINTNAQIYVIDGAYDNPFKAEGVRALALKGGLTKAKVGREKTVGFLFSAAVGQTVLQQTGRTSVFADAFNSEIKKSDYNITEVFNNVKSAVEKSTNYEQVPYSTNTTMEFSFNGNELTALKKIAAEETSDNLQVASYKLRKSYEEEQADQLIQKSEKALKADENFQKIREEAERRKQEQLAEDQMREEEEMLKNLERSFAERKAIEEKRNEFINSAAELSASLQKDSTAEDRIDYIESMKSNLNQLRSVAYDQIEDYNRDVDESTEESVLKIQNADLKITEKDRNGRITETAQRRRNAEANRVIAEGEKQKNDYLQQKQKEMNNDNKQFLPQINTAYTKLESSKYVATSLNDALTVRVGNYDGESASWRLQITSEFFGYPDLFDEFIDLTYTDVTGIKQTDISKMTEAQMDEYNTNVEIYDSLFNSTTPVFYAKLTYQIMRWKKSSEYHFIPVKLELVRLGSKAKVITTKGQDELIPKNFIMYPEEEIRTTSEYDSDVARANKLIAKEEKALEATRNKQIKESMKKTSGTQRVENTVSAGVINASKNTLNKDYISADDAKVEKTVEDPKKAISVTDVNRSIATKRAENAESQQNDEKLHGRSMLLFSYVDDTTNMDGLDEYKFMYPRNNSKNWKIKGTMNVSMASILYWGIGGEIQFWDYRGESGVDYTNPSFGAFTHLGLVIPMGNHFRIFGEGGVGFDTNVQNPNPISSKNAVDELLNFRTAAGFDIILGRVFTISVSYGYDWNYFLTDFVKGKYINGAVSSDTAEIFKNPDFNQVEISVGLGASF